MMTGLLSAQNQRFIYEYKVIPDSTNIEDVKTDLLYLDVTPNSSRFYSRLAYEQDSLKMVDFENQIKTTGALNIDVNKYPNKGYARYTISKEYPEFKTYLHTKISRDNYKVSDNMPINWKIETEKQKIGEFDAQKATTYFQGRKWIAWFTNEIPIQDGPYRFWGLPGLILKLEDTKGDHTFTIVGTKNIDESINQKLNVDKNSKDIIVTEEKFNNLWNEYKKDPAKDVRQQNSSNSSFSSTITFNGKTYSNDEIAREIEKEVKEKLKTENNYIELHLYK